MEGGESEWFSVKVGLRQGCVMSPWLFNLFMDGVMKEFKANILHGRVKFGMRENTGRVRGLLFVDNTTLIFNFLLSHTLTNALTYLCKLFSLSAINVVSSANNRPLTLPLTWLTKLGI